MRAFALVAIVVGCHPPSSPERKEPKAAECPATFAAVKTNADCEGMANCAYPEGTCYCGQGSYCGGTPPSAEIKKENARLRWVCEKKPPAIREDGCPGLQPSGSCSETRECRYSDGCCFVAIKCVNGEWKRSDHQCPP
jgi:hypothetical protein